jgi:hypothetical protein
VEETDDDDDDEVVLILVLMLLVVSKVLRREGVWTRFWGFLAILEDVNVCFDWGDDSFLGFDRTSDNLLIW